MLPSWIRSRNCRPRLVYFLAIEMTRRRLASTISFLACRASRSPFCTALTMRRNSVISRPVSEASVRISLADAVDVALLVLDELAPLAVAAVAHALDPGLVELVAEVLVDEVLARHAVAVGQPHQPALQRDQALVDGVELLHQALDARVVEREALDVADDLVAQLVVAALLLARELLARNLHLDLLVLQLAQLLVGAGDVVEGLEHLGLELGLHGGERERVLEVLVVLQLALGARLAVAAFGAVGGSRGGRGRRDLDRRRQRPAPAAAPPWPRGLRRWLPDR